MPTFSSFLFSLSLSLCLSLCFSELPSLCLVFSLSLCFFSEESLCSLQDKRVCLQRGTQGDLTNTTSSGRVTGFDDYKSYKIQDHLNRKIHYSLLSYVIHSSQKEEEQEGNIPQNHSHQVLHFRRTPISLDCWGNPQLLHLKLNTLGWIPTVSAFPLFPSPHKRSLE